MCIVSLVGIRGVCESSSNTYFIDQIPGINLENAADINNQLGKKTLEDCISNAAADIKTEFSRMLMGKFRLNHSVENNTIGRWSTDYLTAQTKSGIKLEQLCDTCRFASYHIASVEFQPKQAFDGKVVVDIGGAKTEYPVTANAQEKKYLAIDQTIASNKFEIYVESDNSFQLLNANSLCISDLINLNIIGQNGLKVNYQMLCDIDKLICEYKQLFAKAAWYKSGVYFYEELLNSNKITYYTVYKSKEQANEQRHILNARYNDEMKQSTQMIIRALCNLSDCCIEYTGSTWSYST